MLADRRSGSRILRARDGVLTVMGSGRFIRGRATPGYRRIHGGGCPITRARGRSSQGMDGAGSQAALGMD
jgi:hypothetical protein